MSHHRAAVITIVAAVVLDLGFGAAFAFADHVSVANGLYLATAIGSTSGYAQVPVSGWLPHLLVVGMFTTVIPLFAATFSLFTSGLSAVHVRTGHKATVAQVRAEMASAREHLAGVADQHAQALHRRLDDHAELIRVTAQATTRRKPAATPKGM